MIESGAQAAQLEVILRQRERALAELQRVEQEGAAAAPAVAAYQAGGGIMVPIIDGGQGGSLVPPHTR